MTTQKYYIKRTRLLLFLTHQIQTCHDGNSNSTTIHIHKICILSLEGYNTCTQYFEQDLLCLLLCRVYSLYSIVTVYNCILELNQVFKINYPRASSVTNCITSLVVTTLLSVVKLLARPKLILHRWWSSGVL